MGSGIPAPTGWRQELKELLWMKGTGDKKQKWLADQLGVSQSSVSRGALTEHLVRKADEILEADGRLLAAWQMERFAKRNPVSSQFFEDQVDWLVTQATSDRAIDVANWSGHLANHLASLLSPPRRRASSPVGRTLRPEVEELLALAQVTNAWGQLNYRPSREQSEVVRLANQVMDEHPMKHIVVYGTWVAMDAARLLNARAGDIDHLEQLAPIAPTSRPVYSSLYFEELAKQMILSEEHSLQEIKDVVLAGRAAAAGDSNLCTAMPRFDDIEARAIWIKQRDPRRGAALLQGAHSRLSRGGESVAIIRLRVLSFRGLMQLEAASPKIASETIRDAYALADRIKMGYFLDLLRPAAKSLGVLPATRSG